MLRLQFSRLQPSQVLSNVSEKFKTVLYHNIHPMFNHNTENFQFVTKTTFYKKKYFPHRSTQNVGMQTSDFFLATKIKINNQSVKHSRKIFLINYKKKLFP